MGWGGLTGVVGGFGLHGLGWTHWTGVVLVCMGWGGLTDILGWLVVFGLHGLGGLAELPEIGHLPGNWALLLVKLSAERPNVRPAFIANS